jgi:small conductance mechanosensitive channel
LISTRNPFHAGDRIEVAGYTGIVQRVTTRTTVLLSLDGNHIQIPNATIYKSTITNFTANPCQRQEFRLGIGYQDEIADAQALIVTVLDAHAAVLKEPEAQVLVDNLGPLAVELRVAFWYDSQVHEGAKVKSSLIRLVKRALVVEGFTLPNGGREVVLAHSDSTPIPAHRIPSDRATPLDDKSTSRSSNTQATQEPGQLSTAAEGDLRSDDKQIQAQARGARTPEESENLLEPA